MALVFRRRSQDAPGSATALAEQPPTGRARDPQARKGRPTPKRSEVRRSRRVQYTAPTDSKAARQQARDRQRAEATRQRLALINGNDEAALPARDRGPVRRFARDFVDSRHSVAEWFLPVAVVILVMNFLHNPLMQVLSLGLWLTVIVLIALDSIRHAVALRKQLRARFPHTSHGSVIRYALMRTLQMRRLRLPKPQVKRGALH